MRSFFRKGLNQAKSIYRQTETKSSFHQAEGPHFKESYGPYSHYHKYYWYHPCRGHYIKKALFWGILVPTLGYWSYKHWSKDYSFGCCNYYLDNLFRRQNDTFYGENTSCTNKKFQKGISSFKTKLNQVISEKGEESKEAAMLYFIIGVTLNGMESFAESKNYLNKALEIGKKVGDGNSVFVKTVAEAINLAAEEERKTFYKRNYEHEIVKIKGNEIARLLELSGIYSET